MSKNPMTKLWKKLHVHPGHESHLCILWHTYRDLEQIKPLIKDGMFACKWCGRVAAKKENLCEPDPL